MIEEHEDDFVNVPVPRRYVLDVYGFLAAREQKNSTISPTELAGKENRNQWWEAYGRVARLRQATTNKTVLTLLNLAARQPTEWVSFADVCREAGCSSNQARADLRGLTLMIPKLFPDTNQGAWWPVEIRDREGSPIQYCMSEEIARQWNRGPA